MVLKGALSNSTVDFAPTATHLPSLLLQLPRRSLAALVLTPWSSPPVQISSKALSLVEMMVTHLSSQQWLRAAPLSLVVVVQTPWSSTAVLAEQL